MRRTALFAFLVAVALRAAAADLPTDEAARLRGLAFTSPVVHRVVPRSDLRPILLREMQQELPYTPYDYGEILRALEVVPAGSDPVGALLALYEQQVLAFYDPRSGTFYSLDAPPDSVAGVAAAPLFQRAVEVHELTHTLQDQHFGLAAREDAVRGDSDAELAFHALVEGEASLVMLAALAEPMGQSLDDLVGNAALFDMMANASAADAGVPAGTPPYLVDTMKFPYVEGMRFIAAAWRKGGWAAVDRLWANPPRSSREVADPARYLARLDGKVTAVPAHAPSTAGLRLLTTDRLGALHWRLFVGPDAAAGWGDDRAAIVLDDACRPTVLVDSQWDTPADAERFAAALDQRLASAARQWGVERNGTRVAAWWGADAAAGARLLRDAEGERR